MLALFSTVFICLALPLLLASMVLFSQEPVLYPHTFWSVNQGLLFFNNIISHYLVGICIPQLSVSFPKPASFRHGPLHCSEHDASIVLQYQEYIVLLQILLNK